MPKRKFLTGYKTDGELPRVKGNSFSIPVRFPVGWSHAKRSFGAIMADRDDEPAPWYMAATASPIAAWQGKGAASKAASLVNLVNPGTYNLIEVNTMGFADATGWEGSGTAYFRTGIVPAVTYTVALRVAGIDNAFEGLIGAQDGTGSFYIRLTGGGSVHFGVGAAGGNYISAYNTNMTLVFTNTRYNINGTAGALVSGTGNPGIEMHIGAYNVNGTPTYPIDATDFIIGAAVWNSSLTAEQMEAVRAALAAI